MSSQSQSRPSASTSPHRAETHNQYGPPIGARDRAVPNSQIQPPSTNNSFHPSQSSNSSSSPTAVSSQYDLEHVNENPSADLLTSGVNQAELGKSEAVDNPFNELTEQNKTNNNNTNNSTNTANNNNGNGRAFLTDFEDQKISTDLSSGSFIPLSDEELLSHIEKQMLEYERTAQYVEAERARQHLEAVKKRSKDSKKQDLSRIQEEDISVFFSMVGQHQENFDRIWTQKTLEHKIRADELIEQLKWKHDDQQRELYEQLRKKRMPKFSVELLNMRKRQVLLAKSKNYVEAEKIKRKGDMLEAIEIERIRESAREENQLRFQSLLKKQEWDRKSLAQKLKIEKKCLLESKAQDFIRLKKRLRNAEQELKKTHIRQQLLAEKKLVPVYAVQHSQQSQLQSNNNNNNSIVPANNTNTTTNNNPNNGSQSSRGSALRNSGRQRMAIHSSALSSSGGSITSRQRVN